MKSVGFPVSGKADILDLIETQHILWDFLLPPESHPFHSYIKEQKKKAGVISAIVEDLRDNRRPQSAYDCRFFSFGLSTMAYLLSLTFIFHYAVTLVCFVRLSIKISVFFDIFRDGLYVLVL